MWQVSSPGLLLLPSLACIYAGVCACLDMHTCIYLIVLLKRQGGQDGSWGISLLDSLAVQVKAESLIKNPTTRCQSYLLRQVCVFQDPN